MLYMDNFGIIKIKAILIGEINMTKLTLEYVVNKVDDMKALPKL